MTPLPLTVLVYEGPQARAYLAAMRRASYVPARILRLVLTRHPTTKRAIGGWLPGGLRRWYARRYQELAHNAWPRRIRSFRPDLLEAVVRGMEPILPGAGALVAEMLGRFRYEDYAARVDDVLVEGLQDPVLAEALRAVEPRTVLFTGGGILPGPILDLPGFRFLHVHPGFLPHVRGADGMLWSMLVRGRPGVSAFYMARGLDTGDILAAKEEARPLFDLQGRARPDDRTLYRALFSYADPLLRARFLVDEILKAPGDLASRPVTRQKKSAGTEFHFMHDAVLKEALGLLFRGS